MQKLRASWMQQGKFGVMVHWCVPKTPPQHGRRITDINKAADRFDLDRFIKDFSRTRADWLIFTIGQTTGFASPNSVIDALTGPGHCTQRDLILEIAKRVKKLGKRMIVYHPCSLLGQPIVIGAPEPREIRRVVAADIPLEEVHRRFFDAIAEYSKRWGHLVDGWWFDGASANPAFHATALRYLAAARAGNPNSAVALNDGSICLGLSRPVIRGEDFVAGESEFLLNGKIRYGRGTDVLTPLSAGPGSSRPAMGRGVTDATGYVRHLPIPKPPATCLWHALLPIDCMWEHGIPFNMDWQSPAFAWVPPKPHQMESPLYSVADLETVVRDFKSVGGGLTFNVGIFQEGHLGPDTVAQLAKLATRVK